MLKATATINGRRTLLLGLSFGNLDHFRSAPGDSHIMINGEEIGLPIDVLIFMVAIDCLPEDGWWSGLAR